MARVKDEQLFMLIKNFMTVYLPVQRRCSANTVKAYRTTWNQFLKYISDTKGIRLTQISVKLIDYKTVNDYLLWLTEEKKVSPATRNNRLAAIRAFLEYAAACQPEYISLLAEVSTIKIQKMEVFLKIDYMSEEAVKAILQSPDITTKRGLQDQFLMILLYDTGARIQEMMDIKLCDLRMGTTPSVTLHGKGDKVRVVPLMRDTVQHLKNYLKVFHDQVPISADEYLFYVIRKGMKYQMNDDTARIRIKKYASRAREVCPEVPENIHPHLWRHSRAMHLYQRGMPLETVSQWLGHSSTTTTLIYAYADTEAKRRAIERAVGSDAAPDVISEPYTVSDEELLKKLYGL